jgi:hypothetical protein
VKAISAASEEAQCSVPEMTMDSEQAALPPVAPAIEATCKVFTSEEDTEPAVEILRSAPSESEVEGVT